MGNTCFKPSIAEQRRIIAAQVRSDGHKLIAEGHKCVVMIDTNPPMLGWCRKPVCAGDPFERL